MPLISVIVPVYKVEPYLHRCVDSILNQTFSDFELILVDDGSPDNCGAICDEYAAKDSRVVVIHQENGGLSAARNAGIDWSFANSDSEWLTFIDSDDWVHPQYLEILLFGVMEHGCTMSIGKYHTVDHVITMEYIHKPRVQALDPRVTYLTWFYFSVTAWVKMYRKELFRDIRYPVGKLCEDAFTTYKLLFQSNRVAVIDEQLYYYYQNEGSIMHTPWRPAKMDEIAAWETHIAFFRKRKQPDCLARAVRRYIEVLREQQTDIRKTEWSTSRYARQINCKLRRQLLRYLRIYPIRENAAVYEQTFPIAGWCYWTCVGIARKFKRGSPTGKN